MDGRSSVGELEIFMEIINKYDDKKVGEKLEDKLKVIKVGETGDDGESELSK